jgi:hypothetical protein
LGTTRFAVAFLLSHRRFQRNPSPIIYVPWDMDYGYCAFDLNYKTQPDYSAGGLQIHTWDPKDPIEYANSTRTGVMSSSNETVTWTNTSVRTHTVTSDTGLFDSTTGDGSDDGATDATFISGRRPTRRRLPVGRH